MSNAREAATASPYCAVTPLTIGRMAGRRPSLRRPLLDTIKRINGQARLAHPQLVTRGRQCVTPVTHTECRIVLAMIGLGATLH